MSVRTEAIRAPVAAVTADASLAWRRAGLWGLLGAKVVSSWGVQWDIQWHTLIGRDSFWIAPYLMTYAGVVVMVGLSFGVLAATTLSPSRRGGDVVRVLGLTGTHGFHLAAWRSEEHTSELQSPMYLVCRLLLEKKKEIYDQVRIN